MSGWDPDIEAIPYLAPRPAMGISLTRGLTALNQQAGIDQNESSTCHEAETADNCSAPCLFRSALT